MLPPFPKWKKKKQVKPPCSSQTQPPFLPMAFAGRRSDFSQPWHDKCLLALPGISRLFALGGLCQSIQIPDSS